MFKTVLLPVDLSSPPRWENVLHTAAVLRDRAIIAAAHGLEVGAIAMVSPRREPSDDRPGPNAARAVCHARRSVFVVWG